MPPELKYKLTIRPLIAGISQIRLIYSTLRTVHTHTRTHPCIWVFSRQYRPKINSKARRHKLKLKLNLAFSIFQTERKKKKASRRLEPAGIRISPPLLLEEGK